jgi:anti-sigma B factor antagonist
MHTNGRDTTPGALPVSNGNGNGYAAPGHRIVHLGAGTLVVEIVGEHDLGTCDAIQELLLNLVHANGLLVVDLSEATFTDSSFLNLLVKTHRQAEAAGCRMRVQLGTSALIRRVFEISDLVEYLDCVRDRDEALR